MSYSTTATMALDESIPPLFVHHLGALVLGLGVAGVALLIPMTMWKRLALPFWAASVGLLVLTSLWGVTVNGAQRWLEVPGLALRFQPVELAKCATVLAVAAVIAHREGHEELSTRRALWAGALALPPIALLLLQPDLGNAVLLATLVALLLIAAGTKLTRLIPPALAGLCGVVAYVWSNDYARRRITGFMDPWERPLDEGFQLVQSFVAFARGGLTGQGLGNGQQKLAYLPEAHTDFILALVAEEMGLIGVLIVLGGFAGLLVAGTRIATRARDRFALLVAFGMTVLLTVPALVNASVVMGMVPTKGLTLPFLSYGRTSLVVCCGALGLLLGVARSTAAAGGEDRSRAWR
jgi:cell division protein FtsW